MHLAKVGAKPETVGRNEMAPGDWAHWPCGVLRLVWRVLGGRERGESVVSIGSAVGRCPAGRADSKNSAKLCSVRSPWQARGGGGGAGSGCWKGQQVWGSWGGMSGECGGAALKEGERSGGVISEMGKGHGEGGGSRKQMV